MSPSQKQHQITQIQSYLERSASSVNALARNRRTHRLHQRRQDRPQLRPRQALSIEQVAGRFWALRLCCFTLGDLLGCAAREAGKRLSVSLQAWLLNASTARDQDLLHIKAAWCL